MKKLFLLLSVVLLVFWITGTALAAYLTFDGNGQMTGVAEFDIDGVLYDIDFIQDSYDNIFVNNGRTPFFMTEAFEDDIYYLTRTTILEGISELLNVEEWVFYDEKLSRVCFEEDG